MAYITHYSASLIISKLDKDSIPFTNYYTKKIDYLSVKDIKSILAFKLLLENPIEYMDLHRRFKSSSSDNFVHVVDSIKPHSFHKTPDCTFLHANFDSIEMPKRFKDSQKREEFERWLDKNRYLIKQDKIRFEELCRQDFGLSKSEIKYATLSNSGSKKIINYSIEELDGQIEELILKGIENNCSIIAIRNIYKLLEGNDSQLDREGLNKKLKMFYNDIIYPTINLLRQRIQISSNPDLNFEENMLKEAGFAHCSVCYADPKEEIIL